MTLLLMIALAMLSLGTMEVRGKSSQSAQMEARANARLAVMIAIGELQKHAGPDQSVTARGAITGAPDASGTPLPNGWLTGVWPTLAVPEGDALGRDLALRRVSKKGVYLVSGNEMHVVEEGDDYPAGYFTPASSPPSDAVVMGRFGTDGVEQTVRVPRVASGNGAYAYWVEDEGVKARLDLTHPFEGSTEDTEKLAAGLMGHRLRADWIPGGTTPASADGLKNLPQDGAAATWGRVVSVETSELAGADPAAMAAALKGFGNDLSTSSRSLLTDTKRGGFQKDLTSAFQMSRSQVIGLSGSELFPTELVFPQQGTADDGETVGRDFSLRPGGAPWVLLWDYANLESNGNTPLEMRHWSTSNVRDGSAINEFMPVINRVQYFFDVSYEAAGDDQYYVVFHLFPMVTLWNPHDVPMLVKPFTISLAANRNASAAWKNLEFDYKLDGTYQWVDNAGNPQDPAYTPPEMRFGAVSFRSTKDIEIPAGKAMILTTPAEHIAYSDAVSHDLVPVWQDGFGLSNQGAKVRFVDPPGIEVTRHALASNDYGGGSRMYSGTLGFHLEGLNWDLDGRNGTSWEFVPQVRPPEAPLVGNSPRWGGVLVRKTVENQMSVLVGQSTGNAYPANRLGHYNIRGHGFAYVGNAVGTPPQFITGTFVAGSDVTSYVKPDIVNASDTQGPHYAYVDPSDSTSGSPEEKIFHIRRPGEPLLALAEFSHAALGRGYLQSGGGKSYEGRNTGDDLEATFPVGTSLRPPHHPAGAIRANTCLDNRWGEWGINRSMVDDETAGMAYRMDSAFLYNNFLWDSYYLSGSDAAGSGFAQFHNSNLSFINSAGREKFKQADLVERSNDGLSHVMLNGGFNVNSTSKAAWKALLASTVGLAGNAGSSADGPGYTSRGMAETRFEHLNPGANHTSSVNYTGDARSLTEEELDGLAERIVGQVKLRGPFPSYAAFVNRSLRPQDHLRPNLAADQVSNRGALQAAIEGDESTDLNAALSRDAWIAPRDLPASNVYQTNLNGGVYKEALEMALTYGAPMSLDQMNILAKVGPMLRPRSDTFTIHGYGEAKDADGKVVATAKCVATVQRVPEWVGGETAATDVPADGTTAATFGRRFRVVAFEWRK
ncbi:MAG: hypothetical protein H7A51_18270 [Akkermansiaceae bacterium]|nr:hypothetical protein [Akkermansiaceae bacterium]